ncbi:MAG: HAD-IA family hydrolase [Tahibacter sp.]
MPRYDLALFDFDGTLADSFPWFWKMLPEIIVEFRLKPLDATRRDEYRQLSARAIMAEVGIRWWRVPAIARYFRRRMTQEIHTIALFDGIRDMLHRLHAAGVRIAIVSSNTEANVRHVLGTETSACIDHFGCGAPVLGKRRKTLRAIRHAGTSPQRTLCIGDEIRDVDVARAIGADFAGVSWGYTLPAALAAATEAPLLDSPANIEARVLAGPDIRA